ncbi:MAG: ChbG/HpnK family deacetylase, partial [Spirochaetia bacterium]|nr:ChbG/HpnK family deacetylase [Spirochaetia bacterium]
VFDFHADDYAVSISASQDIRTLGGKGAVDSISIIPNMGAFDSSVPLLKKLPGTIKRSIHLNFMEGKSCLPKEEIPDLVDDNSCFKVSWGSLLLASFNPIKRGRNKRQLADEIVAQVEKCIAASLVEPGALRLDSHQHTHMIPLVQDALFDAVDILETQGEKVVFVRNTEDPISLYFHSMDTLKGFSFSNMLKCIILNSFSLRLKRKLKERGLPIEYLCGVFYSGHMDEKRLDKVLPFFEKLAIKKNRRVEVLFHPGSVKKEEITPEFTKPGFVQFHLSNNRHIEFDALCRMSGVSV